jgi:hypothetical protein
MVTETGPNICVLIGGQEAIVSTFFSFCWVKLKLAGSYLFYVGDLPNHELYFPGIDEAESIFLREAEVTVKLSVKNSLVKLSRLQKLYKIKCLLGIMPPNGCYTIEDLVQFRKNKQVVKASVPVSFEGALQTNDVGLILQAVKAVKPTPDQVLDVFKKGQELRSNYLINLARQLSQVT